MLAAAATATAAAAAAAATASAPAVCVEVVVHVTSAHVFESAPYRALIARFGPATKVRVKRQKNTKCVLRNEVNS